MKNPLDENIFKNWTDAQKQLWESLANVLPDAPSAQNTNNWQNAYQKNLATWEAAIKQTLKAEATWLEQWTNQIANTSTVPEPLSEWTRQMEQVMQHWIKTQNHLWEECFHMLREGGNIEPGSAPTPETVEKTAESQPSPVQPIAKENDTTSPTIEGDDLKTISGIGPAMEETLNEMGITTYRQIATLDEEAIQRIETTVPKMAGRIHRDRWVEQAREQHMKKYNDSIQ